MEPHAENISSELRDMVKDLSHLTDTEFLKTWESSLHILSQRTGKSKPQSFYTVQQDNNKLAGCLSQFLRNLKLEAASEESLLASLTAAGLQKERANFFISQHHQLQALLNFSKMGNVEREQLVDLQWNFGVVAGSSVEAETGATFVQLRLISRAPDGTLQPRHLEMSLQKFYDFLHQLEKCKASLEYMNCI